MILPLRSAKEQTACSFPYNGALSATTRNPNDYDWIWYQGTVTSGPQAVIVATDYITPDTLSVNLTNVYTLVATKLSSGCSFTKSITLTEKITPPAIDATNVDILQHQTSCMMPNGQVQISVGASQKTTGYRFILQQGSTIIDANLTGLFTGLEAGPYRAIAEDIVTNCASEPSKVFQISNYISSFGNITLEENPQTNCDPASPNGALSVTVEGNTTDYSFTWYEVIDGVDYEINATSYPNVVFTDTSIANLSSGTYVLEAEQMETGCMGRKSISLTENLPTASFSYAQSSYCQQGVNPIPNVETAGGTFSASAGLVIDASTGEIDLSASMPGTYTIIYAMPNACPEDGSFTLTILPESDVSFHYNQSSYYSNESNPLPEIEGSAGGTFTSDNPANLVIDNTTGKIDLSASSPGAYTIIYTTSAACAASSTVEIVLLEMPTIAVSRATICAGEKVKLSVTGRNAEETYQWDIINAENTYVGLPDSLRTAQQLAYVMEVEGVYEARVTLSNSYMIDTVLVTSFVVEVLPEITLPESLNLFERFHSIAGD